MDEVQAQYEAFPYPERDPRDEKKRLITGSPSWPQEMDHWLWGGVRDWSKPLKILVAGGGTGDGLIQLAQTMTSARRAYDITYLDLSVAARKIAEERAKVRGLQNIKFVTESLLNAQQFGDFDYIDCCGVLHHLPDPRAGFNALANALAPNGGIGLMVYAPLGRSGVYPLQSAFTTLSKRLAPKEKLTMAKRVFKAIPDGHPFKSNPNLVDHKASDAGFYDLLLHSSDRPYKISELDHALETAGLTIAGTPEPALYDSSVLVSDPDVLNSLSRVEKMQVAEDLRGSFKVHVVYAKKPSDLLNPPLGNAAAVPHLRGIDARKLGAYIAKNGAVQVTTSGQRTKFDVPRSAGNLVAVINGKRDLAAIRSAAGLDQFAFANTWRPVERALTGFGLLHYSQFLAS